MSAKYYISMSNAGFLNISVSLCKMPDISFDDSSDIDKFWQLLQSGFDIWIIVWETDALCHYL